MPELPSEYADLDESELYITALKPIFFGKTKMDGKMVLQFMTDGGEKTACVYETSDGGATWTPDGESGLAVDKYSFVDNSGGFAIDRGRLYRPDDGGLTWSML
jgi:photosystem II stability/assembly factor-like uncharacterized protein